MCYGSPLVSLHYFLPTVVIGYTLRAVGSDQISDKKVDLPKWFFFLRLPTKFACRKSQVHGKKSQVRGGLVLSRGRQRERGDALHPPSTD